MNAPPPATSRPRPRVVSIGGGHGMSRTLAALRTLEVDTTAVVAMADDGGSSGRLRDQLGVVPPGDLRKALSSLVPDPELAAWVEHRFDRGDLGGHSLGNLMLVGLQAARDGDLVGALRRLGALLGARGQVLPSTLAPVALVADGDGGEVTGQVAIARSSGHRRVRLEPADVSPPPAVVAAIGHADLVVLGPGSLFTSILPNVVVPDIGRALRTTDAPIVMVANLREQPGETTGMDLAAHLRVLHEHLDGRDPDVLVAHTGERPSGPGKPLEVPASPPHVGAVVRADLLDGADGHAPASLARVLDDLLRA